MKKIVSILLFLSIILSLPAQAGIVRELEPIEKELMTPQNPSDRDNKQMNDDFAEKMKQTPDQARIGKEQSGSNWWKWALGIAIIGVVAVAAGGSGDSGTDSSPSTGTGAIAW